MPDAATGPGARSANATAKKERASHGKATQPSRTSTEDISSGQRGGLRSHRGSGGRSYDQLRREAKARGVKGRSRMNKEQLEKVLSRYRARGAAERS